MVISFKASGLHPDVGQTANSRQLLLLSLRLFVIPGLALFGLYSQHL